MSVAQLSARELGAFAATAAHLELIDLDRAISLAIVASKGNVAAWEDSYSDKIEPADAKEIESIARSLVGDEDALLEIPVSGVTYNMVSQRGRAFLAPGLTVSQDVSAAKVFFLIKKIERDCSQWIEGKLRELKRREENAVAYNEVGQLAVRSLDDINEEAARLGYDRIIVAEFNVDESEAQSDYYGGRKTRTVVIGYGKGKRESFAQLREAAAGFKPTSRMAPGKDIWTARVVFANSVTSNGKAYWEGAYSHWHSELYGDSIDPPKFATEDEAKAYIERVGEPHEISFDGVVGKFKWSVSKQSYEHRENWSMGGGNYLGSGRYSGWKVRSHGVGWSWGPKQIEVASFEAKPVNKAPAAKRPKAEPVIVSHEVTDRGDHKIMVAIGKRETGIIYTPSSGQVWVYTGKSRFGEYFPHWEAARRNYRLANIVSSIQAAEDAVRTRLEGNRD